MTYRPPIPGLITAVDDLIRDARREERLQVGVDMHPELKLAKHLRKAQVQTRRSRKTLIHLVRDALAAESHVPDMEERSARKLAKKERTG